MVVLTLRCSSPNCGLENGHDALSFMAMLGSRTDLPPEIWRAFVAIGLLDLGLLLLAALAFLIIQQKPYDRKYQSTTS